MAQTEEEIYIMSNRNEAEKTRYVPFGRLVKYEIGISDCAIPSV